MPERGRRLFDSWIHRRLANVLVVLAGLLLLALFYPAAVGVKIGVALAIALVVVAGSFVAVDVAPRPPTRRQMFSAAKERPSSELPAVAKLDLNRPILAMRVTGDGEPTMYLLALERAGLGRVAIVPATTRGRPPEGAEYDSVAEARRSLRRMGAGILPQSDFTDEVAAVVFGSDWRESTEWD
jgi:hypothetical protein